MQPWSTLRCYTERAPHGVRGRRSLSFSSDLDLRHPFGHPGCQAYYLLDFLRTHKANTLYLVGDILDGWQLKKSWYWPQAHNDVVQKILRSARKGTKVVYVPGNHDELVRQFIGAAPGRDRHRRRRDPHDRGRQAAPWSCTAICSTALCSMRAGSRISATGVYTIPAGGQSLAQRDPSAPSTSVLVACPST